MGDIKSSLKNGLLSVLVPQLERSSNSVDRFLGRAAGVHRGRITQPELLDLLDNFYASHTADCLSEVFGYHEHRSSVLDSGYKLDILSYRSRGPWIFEATGLWRKRLHLLRHLGLRMDWLMLRRDQTIPPHAHRGVLSGFMVLEGAVAIRHFDVAAYAESGVSVQPTINRDLMPGEFTTNAEHRDNIHWLQGLADVSVLFRFNAVQLPSSVPQLVHADGRMYVDVSGAREGVVTEVPFVSAREAAVLRIR